MRTQARVLFLGKANDSYSQKALSFCRANIDNLLVHLSSPEAPFPQELTTWRGDYILAFRPHDGIPNGVIEGAEKGVLNFHPGSPAYPGIGACNYALYENADAFGVTCHYVEVGKPFGQIAAARSFPVFEADDVPALTTRTLDHLLVLFYEIVASIIQEEALPQEDASWLRDPITDVDLKELMRIVPGLEDHEIARRIRATRYGSWQPIGTYAAGQHSNVLPFRSNVDLRGDGGGR